MADQYPNYAALQKMEREGVDYRIVCEPRESSDAVILAPHGGAIERQTSEIASEIASDQFSFYAFEGLKASNNRFLHITSASFDEPRALELLKKHTRVLAIHGCGGQQNDVLLGGLDTSLVEFLRVRLDEFGVPTRTSGHKFLGAHPSNICNRGKSGVGAQVELSVKL